MIDVARVPRLDWARVCRHLPDRRRIRIDINGHLAGSPSCVPDAVNEFAVGWAFLNRFFSAPRELSKVTAVSHGVAIMVESGVDMDRRRHEAIGWTDNGEQDDFLPSTGPPLAPGSVHAGPMIDDLDLLSLCERAFQRFDADGAGVGYVHSSLCTRDDMVCIARDLSTEASAAKVLGWTLQGDHHIGPPILIVRGVVDAAVIGASARAGVGVVATDAVPTRAAVELAGRTCTSVLGLAMSHRRALFADGGHVRGDD